MIAYADKKAALAWLDQLSHAVEGTNPAHIFEVVVDANEFYDRLEPESPDELQAIGYAVDAIAAAYHKALCLLELDR